MAPAGAHRQDVLFETSVYTCSARRHRPVRESERAIRAPVLIPVTSLNSGRYRRRPAVDGGPRRRHHCHRRRERQKGHRRQRSLPELREVLPSHARLMPSRPRSGREPLPGSVAHRGHPGMAACRVPCLRTAFWRIGVVQPCSMSSARATTERGACITPRGRRFHARRCRRVIGGQRHAASGDAVVRVGASRLAWPGVCSVILSVCCAIVQMFFLSLASSNGGHCRSMAPTNARMPSPRDQYRRHARQDAGRSGSAFREDPRTHAAGGI